MVTWNDLNIRIREDVFSSPVFVTGEFPLVCRRFYEVVMSKSERRLEGRRPLGTRKEDENHETINVAIS